MIAARVSSVIVGIMAITVGILAKGQNVAHLVALAFAVAASSNLPAVFLTLYWKKCNTTGIIVGHAGRRHHRHRAGDDFPQHDLSQGRDQRRQEGAGRRSRRSRPNWPRLAEGGFICDLFAVSGCKKAEPAKPEQAAKPGAPEKLAKLQEKLPTLTDEKDLEKAKKDIAGLEKSIKKAEDDLKKMEGQTTSMMGLEKPFFQLKNPGLISIPLGFLLVILGSLLTRDKRAEDMWDELYVRQNTGINAEAATAH